MNALEKLIASNFEGAYSYASYRQMIDQLHEEGKVTGPTQNDSLLAYSKMNVQRMNRWDKHAKLSEESKNVVKSISEKMTWLIITEGWCGEAAQIVPVIEKLAEENELIQTKFILRDENLEIMDMYLTNGKSRSIPIILLINQEGNVIGKFGPRPAAAQELIDQLKEEGADGEMVKEKLHLWYARDKHAHIEMEFVSVLKAALVIS